jgi:hypothetical protein
MIFVAFDLRQILVPGRVDPPACALRIVEARNLQDAKTFMRKYYPGHWAIIPKRVYDQGVINPPPNFQSTPRPLELLETNNRLPH